MNDALIVPLLCVALGWAAMTDLLYRRISNRLVLVLLAGWLLHLALAYWRGLPGWNQGLSAGVLLAVAIVLVGYGLFVMRWMGAGDVKLMAVLSLWLGDEAFTFLLLTSLAGGVLALALPLVRRIEKAIALFVLHIGVWVPALRLDVPVSLRDAAAQGRGGIPYGLAIAAGGAIVLLGSA